MVKYKRDEQLEALVKDIASVLKLNHINKYKILCVRSKGSKTKAIARIWAFPKIYQTALGVGPFYIIEFIDEKFQKLSKKEKIKTIIHELLHIPKNFSGSLVGHKKGNINEKREEELYNVYVKKKINEEII